MMRKTFIFFISFLIMLGLVCNDSKKTESIPSKIVIIRHGDKNPNAPAYNQASGSWSNLNALLKHTQDEKTIDPCKVESLLFDASYGIFQQDIDAKGIARAFGLSMYFSNFFPSIIGASRADKIYTTKPSTRSLRPFLTIAPTAYFWGKDINIQFKEDETLQLVEQISLDKSLNDKNILICWEHHNIVGINDDNKGLINSLNKVFKKNFRLPSGLCNPSIKNEGYDGYECKVIGDEDKFKGKPEGWYTEIFDLVIVLDFKTNTLTIYPQELLPGDSTVDGLKIKYGASSVGSLDTIVYKKPTRIKPDCSLTDKTTI